MLESCRSSIDEEKQNRGYLYGKCIAIIFLTELDAAAHRDLINAYVSQLKDYQKEHGGFGYQGIPTGRYLSNPVRRLGVLAIVESRHQPRR